MPQCQRIETKNLCSSVAHTLSLAVCAHCCSFGFLLIAYLVFNFVLVSPFAHVCLIIYLSPAALASQPACVSLSRLLKSRVRQVMVG